MLMAGVTRGDSLANFTSSTEHTVAHTEAAVMETGAAQIDIPAGTGDDQPNIKLSGGRTASLSIAILLMSLVIIIGIAGKSPLLHMAASQPSLHQLLIQNKALSYYRKAS